MQEVSEANVSEKFIEKLRDVHPRVSGLEFLGHLFCDCVQWMDSQEKQILEVMQTFLKVQ